MPAWGVLGVLSARVGGVLVVGTFWTEGGVCVLGVWRGSSIAVVAMALTMFFLLGHRGLEAGWGPWQLAHLMVMASCSAFLRWHTSVG